MSAATAIAAMVIRNTGENPGGSDPAIELMPARASQQKGHFPARAPATIVKLSSLFFISPTSESILMLCIN
jgi:hypothetical protein